MYDPSLGDLQVQAVDDPQRLARANTFLWTDPFPSVPIGLLSTAEIKDYVRVTGMLDEFDETRVKAASYEVFAGGDFIHWEGDKRKRKIIRAGMQYITLPANSISFIQVRNFFMLPSYIAVRFNLRIAHVHRGLLLGTGPLVDPGFRGRLLIPLHNLTSTEYRVDLTEALIWVEFTKTTANFDGFTDVERALLLPGRETRAKKFPSGKADKAPDYYLFRASNGQPIQSSIPEAIDSASEDAKSARETVESLQRWARGIGILTILGAVVGVAGIVTATWSNIRSVDKDVSAALKEVQAVKGIAEANARGIASFEDLKARVVELERTRVVAPSPPMPDEERAVASAVRRIAELESVQGDLRNRIVALEAKPAPIAVPPGSPVTKPGAAAAGRGRKGRRRRGNP